MTTIIAVNQFIQLGDEAELGLYEYLLVFATHNDSGDAQVRRLVAETIVDVADSFDTVDMTSVEGAAFIGQLITRAVWDGLIVMPIPVAIDAGNEVMTLTLYASGGVDITLDEDDGTWDPGMFVLRFATDDVSWN